MNGLDRRGDCQEERSETKAERNEPASGPAIRIAATQHEPAAQIKDGCHEQREEHPRLERPGSQDGVERGVHRNISIMVTVGPRRPVGPRS